MKNFDLVEGINVENGEIYVPDSFGVFVTNSLLEKYLGADWNGIQIQISEEMVRVMEELTDQTKETDAQRREKEIKEILGFPDAEMI